MTRARVVAGFAVAVVLTASLLPGSGTGLPAGVDKLAHAAGYAVLGLVGRRALSVRSRGELVAVALAAAGLGAAVELVQPLVGRDASLLDAIANLVGATAGLVFWHIRATSTTDGLAD